MISFLLKESVLEVKLSGAAIGENQAKQLAMYASKNAKTLTYIFFNKPSSSQLENLGGWIKEVAPDLALEINYLYP